jgi:hypothetical protein
MEWITKDVGSVFKCDAMLPQVLDRLHRVPCDPQRHATEATSVLLFSARAAVAERARGSADQMRRNGICGT